MLGAPGIPFGLLRSSVAAWLLVAAGFAACAVLNGCGTLEGEHTNVSAADEQAWIEPIDRRIDAVTGMMLILPVRIVGGAPEPLPPVDVRLSGGDRLEAVLRWITIRPDPGSAAQQGIDAWLPPAGLWGTSVAPPTEAALTMTVAAIQLPAEAAGQDLVLGRRRIKINWLPDPSVLASDPAVDFHPGLPATLRESRILQRITRPERMSPVRRWRYRMMTTGLHPAITPPRIAGEPAQFADPVLEALAEQTEARWTIAMGLLTRQDPRTAAELTAALCTVAEFEDEVIAPVWTVDQAALDELLSDLLTPQNDPGARVLVARAWLDRRPEAIAWMIDDAADQDGVTRQRVPRVGLANLTTRPVMAWSSWLDAAGRELGGRPQGEPLGPMRAMEVPVPIVAGAQQNQRTPTGVDVQSATLAVHAGQRESRVKVDLGTVDAAPPGVLVGPLITDRTLEQFLAGRGAPPPDAAWTTSAMLYRTSALEGSGWELYISCARPSAMTESSFPDQIVIHAGPRSRPRMVLRIDEQGGTELLGDERSSERGAQVRVTRQGERWVAVVALPATCVEDQGMLRLGLERTDARGVRTAWPRPMLPWQKAPARAVINLAAWNR